MGTAMRVLYRPHRGNLSDAMSELYEFKNTKEMVNFLLEKEKDAVKIFGNKIIWERYGTMPDERIGWEANWIVSLEGYGVIGFFTRGISKEDSLKRYAEWLEEEKKPREHVDTDQFIVDAMVEIFYGSNKNGKQK